VLLHPVIDTPRLFAALSLLCRTQTPTTLPPLLPQTAIQTLDIAFNHCATMDPDFLSIGKGRSVKGVYDSKNPQSTNIGGGAQVGFFE